MAYLDPKGERDSSMPLKRRPCSTSSKRGGGVMPLLSSTVEAFRFSELAADCALAV